MIKATTSAIFATTSLSDLITTSNSSTLTMIQATNVTTVQQTLNVAYVANGGSVVMYLANVLALPGNSSVSILAGKMVMNAGDKIRVSAGSANSVSFIVSAVENP